MKTSNVACIHAAHSTIHGAVASEEYDNDEYDADEEVEVDDGNGDDNDDKDDYDHDDNNNNNKKKEEDSADPCEHGRRESVMIKKVKILLMKVRK